MQYFSSFWRFDLGYDLSCVMRELCTSARTQQAAKVEAQLSGSTPNMVIWSWITYTPTPISLYVDIYLHINIYRCVWTSRWALCVATDVGYNNRGLPLGTRQQHVAPMIAENILREPLQHNHASVLSVSAFWSPQGQKIQFVPLLVVA